MASCPHPYDLQSYVDEALSPEHEAQVRRHIATCPDCTECVTELERIRSLINSEPVEPPQGLLGRLLEIVRHASPVRRLSCRQAQRMASEYIDDELSQPERETLEVHLFACDECFYKYMAMRRAAHIMRDALPVAAATDLKDRIIQAVSDQSEQDERERAPDVIPFGLRWKRVAAPVAAVAAVALLAFGIMYVAMTPGRTNGATVAAPEQPLQKVVSRGVQASTDAAVEPSELADKATGEDAADGVDEQPDDGADDSAVGAVDWAPVGGRDALAERGSAREHRRPGAARGHRSSPQRSPGRRQQPERQLAATAVEGEGREADAALSERIIEPAAVGSDMAALGSRGACDTASLTPAERTARSQPNASGGLDTESGLPEPASGIGSVPETGVVAVAPLEGEGREQGADGTRPPASAIKFARQPVIRPERPRKKGAEPQKHKSAPENALAHRSVGESGRSSIGHNKQELVEGLQEIVRRANRRIKREPEPKLIEQEGILIEHKAD